MLVIGLTGSIGMGKSTVAKMLRADRIPVFDADAYVHRALNRGGVAVAAVAKIFPKSYDPVANRIDRKKLGQLVFHDPQARGRLEAVLHPLVRAAEYRFIRRHARARARIIVLDIPLLYETGAEALCDYVICVTAPPFIQRARVLKRPGMTAEKFAHILATQMGNAEKCARAHFVLQTGLGRAQTWRDLQTFLSALQRPYA